MIKPLYFVPLFLVIGGIVVGCTGALPSSDSNNNGLTITGTETHGGDIFKARALQTQEWILYPTHLSLSSGIRSAIVDEDISFRGELNLLWQSLKYQYDLVLIRDPEVFNSLKIIFDSSNASYDIFKDISNAPFDVKTFTPDDWDPFHNTDQSLYGLCYNYHGAPTAAGAKLNDKGGSICIDAKELAKKAASEIEILALVSHEFAHHFGLSELKALNLQKYIIKNFPFISHLARRIYNVVQPYTLSITSPLSFDTSKTVQVKLEMINPPPSNFFVDKDVKITTEFIYDRTIQDLSYNWNLDWGTLALKPEDLVPGSLLHFHLSEDLSYQALKLTVLLGNQVLGITYYRPLLNSSHSSFGKISLHVNP